MRHAKKLEPEIAVTTVSVVEVLTTMPGAAGKNVHTGETGTGYSGGTTSNLGSNTVPAHQGLSHKHIYRLAAQLQIPKPNRDLLS